MIIAGRFSFADGDKVIRNRYGGLLREVEQIIKSVDASECKTKLSREKTMPGRQLFSPRALSKAFKKEFLPDGWINCKVLCEYSQEF